jgi:hypothetical protein
VTSSDEPGIAWAALTHWGRGGSAWLSFRDWRHSRPFWGGLLLLLSGLELLAIPLSSVLARGSIKLVIYIGIGGVAGVLIGALLIACGVLIWLHPAHRVFYSVAAVLLAVASFVVTNLGGFFLGMLLGVIGGSLSFAWTPQLDAPAPEPGDRPESSGPSRLLAYAMPLLLLGLGLPAHSAARAKLTAAQLTAAQLTAAHSAAAHSAAAQPSPPQCILPIPIPILCPSPSPNPTPNPTAAPPVPLPVPLPSLSPAPSASASSAPPGSPRPGLARRGRKASAMKAPAPALQVSGAQFSLVTGSALLQGSAYQGVAHVPVAGGGTVDMMRFTMSSLTLAGTPTLTVREGGVTSSASGSSMQFTGNVVLYATKLSGDLAGVPVTLTPSSPLSLVLQLLGSVTQRVELQLTHVTTDQPYISTDALQIGALQTGTPR